MAESADSSSAQHLLNARNAILIAIGILVLSIIWMCLKMLRPNDSDGLARDTFGTHGDGYRALLETLEELQVPVTRSLEPPSIGSGTKTFVLLGPDPQLVQYEPKYLTSLKVWIENGGRLIVAPHRETESPRQDEEKEPGERDILKLLGVADSVTLTEQSSAGGARPQSSRQSRNSGRSFPREAWDTWNYQAPPHRQLPVTATGLWAQSLADVHQVATPGHEFSVLVSDAQKPSGALLFKAKSGAESLLAAVIPRGKGEIIVVSDPALFSNELLAQADNSVLALKLLAPRGQPVVFDEYYHGLAVRGNPLFLLTRPSFAAVTLALLLVVAAVAWRGAVFLGPPLADAARSRRDIQEYINAMGAFFSRGPGHRRFLVREVRDGVLHEICEQLHLPPHTTDVDVVAHALARRNPQRAEALRTTVAEVDRQLASSAEYPKANFLSTLHRLAGCL
jgi:hypothetical protein